jgi:chaperonin GroES
MEKLIPLEDRILVRRKKEEDTYKGIIHLPDQARTKAQVATVIAVGPGRFHGDQLIPCAVHVGDKIMFGKYTGTDVALEENGEQVEYTIMREEDVLGILQEA